MDIYQKIPKEKLVAFSGEHLYYELRMLYGVTLTLWKGTSNFYIYNALLEAFVLHASIIIDFFYRPPVEDDDARAVHYVRDIKAWRSALPPLSEEFKKFIHKRNKEVVHLSYKRLEVTPEEKRWGSRRLTKQIKKIVNLFLDHADPELIHPRLLELRTGEKSDD